MKLDKEFTEAYHLFILLTLSNLYNKHAVCCMTVLSQNHQLHNNTLVILEGF